MGKKELHIEDFKIELLIRSIELEVIDYGLSNDIDHGEYVLCCRNIVVSKAYIREVYLLICHAVDKMRLYQRLWKEYRGIAKVTLLDDEKINVFSERIRSAKRIMLGLKLLMEQKDLGQNLPDSNFGNNH